MAWARGGDTAATYPPLMAVLGLPRMAKDERIVNELFGWLHRLYYQGAAHETDYVIDAGTAHLMGGTRTPDLIRVAKKLGLLTETTDDRGLRAYRLTDDPNFIHVRTKAELDFERQQRTDGKNPALKGPVLRRDGDNCRYCRASVYWRGTPSARSGSLDHTVPGREGDIGTVVVSCVGCNSEQRDAQGLERKPLQPIPDAPRWGRVSARYLAQHGYLVLDDEHLAYLERDDIRNHYLVAHGDRLVCGPATPGERGDRTTGQRPAPADTAPAVCDPTTSDTAADTTQPPGRASPEPVDAKSTSAPLSTDCAGSGRVGSGQHSRSSPNPAGTGTPAAAGTRPPPGQPRPRRRSRRGRSPEEGTTPT